MNYHAHIYWRTADERQTAMAIRTYLHDNGCALGRIWDRPIGPHPLPMYQVMYDSSIKDCIEQYLTKNHNLSILLHEDIGVDHVRDHTAGARWIGPQLDLDLDFLQRIE
jgi:aromatic ring-cleaving dioxygenase